MTIQNINIGSAELAGDGESIRVAFEKINNNFQEVTQRVSIMEVQLRTVASKKGADGDVAGNIAVDSNYFYFCKAAYDGSSDIWSRIAWDNTW